ncbi:MAG: hypothetical protein GY696_04085 [Gammaproteobacteria bacterium]|nr:hypothetical protein [Gammaproteobacteria bacterium]
MKQQQQPCVVGPKIKGPQSPMSQPQLQRMSRQGFSLLFARGLICFTFLWAFLIAITIQLPLICHYSSRYYNDEDM